MNRTIEYLITEKEDGLRIEQFLRRKGYSGQNLAEIKRMPKSILVNGVHYYMRQTLTAGDILKVIICETKCSEKIPPVEIPLDIIYEETESLFKRSVASREICELRNMVNVGYLIMRQAMERKESRGLHYTIDYPHAKK
jgi:23S rRNA pseudouridine1911/1915/1917 synthase